MQRSLGSVTYIAAQSGDAMRFWGVYFDLWGKLEQRRLPLRVPNEFAVDLVTQMVAALVVPAESGAVWINPHTAAAIEDFYRWLPRHRGALDAVPYGVQAEEVIEFLLSAEGPLVLSRQ